MKPVYSLPTQFAPAERASKETLQREAEVVNDNQLKAFLNSVPDILLVLNQYRQIVYTNLSLLKVLGIDDPALILGFRPGEALDCIHAFETEGGCGTTDFCSTCGAVRAILTSQSGAANVQECRILQRKTGQALDLRVWATPITLAGEPYTIFVVNDISDEKRRKALERLFFHDVLNTAGGIRGTTELLNDATTEELQELKEMMAVLSEDLIRQITAQRELTQAENNELILHPEAVLVSSLMNEVGRLYQHHLVSNGRQIVIKPPTPDFGIITDRGLLERVLSNLVKNALEACEVGEQVTLSCRQMDESRVEFSVHNPSVMPRDVQLQIFQRSFSTKGNGRGLGTYSIKLLTERYLQGQASFTSRTDEGTTFYVHYPLRINPPQPAQLAE